MSDEIAVMDLGEWKKRITNGDVAVSSAVIRKQAIAELEDLGNRQIRFTISTSDIDRERDRLDAKGWKLDSYKQNPVVMFAHDYKQLPVAKAVSVSEKDGKLMSTAEFATADLNPFADTVYRMIKAGFLNAVSVGFRPNKFKAAEREDGSQGFDFQEQELLEYSVVPIPANPQALVAASLDGIDVDPITEWAKSWLSVVKADESTSDGIEVDAEEAEETAREEPPNEEDGLKESESSQENKDATQVANFLTDVRADLGRLLEKLDTFEYRGYGQDDPKKPKKPKRPKRESDAETESASFDGADFVLDLVDDDEGSSHDAVEVDPSLLGSVITEAAREQVANMVGSEVRAWVNKVSGRVD